jgi:hypothetical protein
MKTMFIALVRLAGWAGLAFGGISGLALEVEAPR